jgi:hypothetical protein
MEPLKMKLVEKLEHPLAHNLDLKTLLLNNHSGFDTSIKKQPLALIEVN